MVVLEATMEYWLSITPAVSNFTGHSFQVVKIENSKDLGFQLITSYKEVLRINGKVTKLVNNCKRITSEMESIIADITSKTSLDERDKDKGYIDKQPEMGEEEDEEEEEETEDVNITGTTEETDKGKDNDRGTWKF
jgi:Ran GTPase-activating protein (RanGAP) involved in mRNA processing and transport